MSQIKLAKLVGRSQETISQYENGTRTPNIKTAREIATALDVKLEDVFFGNNISK